MDGGKEGAQTGLALTDGEGIKPGAIFYIFCVCTESDLHTHTITSLDRGVRVRVRPSHSYLTQRERIWREIGMDDLVFRDETHARTHVWKFYAALAQKTLHGKEDGRKACFRGTTIHRVRCSRCSVENYD